MGHSMLSQMPQINTNYFSVHQHRSVLITVPVVLFTDHSEIASGQCLQPKNETTKPRKKTWSLVLEAIPSSIHGALIIKDASREKCCGTL